MMNLWYLGTQSAELNSMNQSQPFMSKPWVDLKMGPDKEILYWSITNQVGACGVANLYSFETVNLNTVPEPSCKYYLEEFTKEKLHTLSGGCGFLSVGFIDTPLCAKMYKDLKEKFPILYQSPIRFNNNSGNNFFFAVFDTGEKKKSSKFYNRDGEGFKDGVNW